MESVVRKILMNAFNMNSVGHIAHGLWRHPRDRSIEYTKLSYWTDLARLLERGRFDGLFLADVIGVNDVYGHSHEAAAQEAVQLPINDPMLLVSAMAAVTENLGFGVTSNLTYEPPYLLARRFSTLDHLTDGRIGWNIVTGYLDSAARGMGLDGQTAHARRYDMADDYMDCVYKLWENSWEDDAVRRDKSSGVFADPAKIHVVDHASPFLRMNAVHLCEPSPQRTPVLYQAGSSGRGLDFAAKHAECVFVAGRSREQTKELVADLRNRVRAAGRDPRAVLVFHGVIVVVAPTASEARDQFEDYKRYASPRAGLVHLAASTGVDYSRFTADEAIGTTTTQSMVSVMQAVAKGSGDAPTVEKLLRQMELGTRMPAIVGDPSHVADELEAWVDEADVDGFNLIRHVTPESFESFVDLVVPELQTRGRYKADYENGPLRTKLFGGGAGLPTDHAGHGFRRR